MIGAEAMFDWVPNTSNTITATGAGPACGLHRRCYDASNRWLKGGAWVGASNPEITVNGAPASFTNTSTSTNFGWTAGAGIEWAFSYGWSARAEWDYIRLQNQNFTVAGTAPGGFANDVISVNNRNINMFTAGLNYKFGGWW